LPYQRIDKRIARGGARYLNWQPRHGGSDHADPAKKELREHLATDHFGAARVCFRKYRTIHYIGEPSGVIPWIMWCAQDRHKFCRGASFEILALEQLRLRIWNVRSTSLCIRRIGAALRVT